MAALLPGAPAGASRALSLPARRTSPFAPAGSDGDRAGCGCCQAPMSGRPVCPRIRRPPCSLLPASPAGPLFLPPGVRIFSPTPTASKPVPLPRGCRTRPPQTTLFLYQLSGCVPVLPSHLETLDLLCGRICVIENGGWTRRAGSCCLSHLDEVWHDSLVVAVESRKGGSCELSWIHLAKLLSKVLSPWSWSVNTLAFHPQRRNGFPDLREQGSLPWHCRWRVEVCFR